MGSGFCWDNGAWCNGFWGSRTGLGLWCRLRSDRRFKNSRGSLRSPRRNWELWSLPRPGSDCHRKFFDPTKNTLPLWVILRVPSSFFRLLADFFQQFSPVFGKSNIYVLYFLDAELRNIAKQCKGIMLIDAIFWDVTNKGTWVSEGSIIRR